jgi:RNA polymerase sigma-70 factor (ECF subfamily)
VRVVFLSPAYNRERLVDEVDLLAVLDDVTGARVADVADVSRVRELLERGVDEARASWPEIRVEPAGFVRHVATHVKGGQALEHDLSTLAWSDLYLAYGCLVGDTAALGAFARLFESESTRAVGRLKLDHDTAQDIKQKLETRLLVADGNVPARLFAYAGRGPLSAWLRTAAVRAALSDTRRARRMAGDEALQAAELLTSDPEAEYIRDRYAVEYRQAFEEALATLSVRARTLLKLHLLEELTVDQIARAYGEHRSSIWRALKGARDQILTEARTRLTERLSLSAREFESLMRLVQSQLELDLSALLTDSEPPGS